MALTQLVLDGKKADLGRPMQSGQPEPSAIYCTPFTFPHQRAPDMLTWDEYQQLKRFDRQQTDSEASGQPRETLFDSQGSEITHPTSASQTTLPSVNAAVGRVLALSIAMQGGLDGTSAALQWTELIRDKLELETSNPAPISQGGDSTNQTVSGPSAQTADRVSPAEEQQRSTGVSSTRDESHCNAAVKTAIVQRSLLGDATTLTNLTLAGVIIHDSQLFFNLAELASNRNSELWK